MASRWSGRVALVTGASAGIGFEVARQLAQLGMIVIGCARNVEKIKELGEKFQLQIDNPGSIHAIQCDVSNEDQILAMFSEIKTKFGGVDVCINNAGVTKPECLIDGKTEGWRLMMEVNVLGLCMCTREAIKSMRERNVDDGHVIHLNSASGHTVPSTSTLHFYSATKFAVTALTEGLRQELREIKSHIRITSLSPGYVETEIIARSYGDEYAKKLYSGYDKCLQPSDIADLVVYVLQAPPHVQVHDVILTSNFRKHTAAACK